MSTASTTGKSNQSCLSKRAINMIGFENILAKAFELAGANPYDPDTNPQVKTEQRTFFGRKKFYFKLVNLI